MLQCVVSVFPGHLDQVADMWKEKGSTPYQGFLKVTEYSNKIGDCLLIWLDLETYLTDALL